MARGEFVVVMDDESRENEGDLVIPAQMAGLIGTRYILCLEPIASMPADELIEIYRAPLRLALDPVHES